MYGWPMPDYDFLIPAADLDAGLLAMANQIATRHAGGSLVLVGVRRGGDLVVERLARHLADLANSKPDCPRVTVGSVDITLYRDDAAAALPNPRIGPSQLPSSLDQCEVVLVDDVLHTRRTIRAAIDALFDYGRPANIELAVVVDRGGRQLPIQADYLVHTIDHLGPNDRVDIIRTQQGLCAILQPVGAPSIPPPQ
jgi:pyrimidine operon attenuation protein / uracil phosphoribosyltransferase